MLYIGDLTGPGEAFGKTYLIGEEAATSNYNQHGEIDGHKIKITSASDNSDNTTAVSVLLQELDSFTPTIVDSDSESSDVAAMIPVLATKPAFAVDFSDITGQ